MIITGRISNSHDFKLLKKKNIMEIWLKKSIELVRKSFIDLDNIDYKNMIYLFYEYFSNRNLAKFISCLYDKDENSLLFEIDDVIRNKKYNINEVEELMVCLKKNGFDEWKELD